MNALRRDDLRRFVFPFTALVGQEEMKRALLINVIQPSLHGVLVQGERGTAKSTAVRALSFLLPEIPVVEGCPFQCDPAAPASSCRYCREASGAQGGLPRTQRRMRVVELPISATEDRVVGTLDMEHALRKGEQRFSPGILAEVHRGILYIDEVNLLNDHVMDLLLDAAAMGVNVVEREGVSRVHPSRFVLVGTMNPEEGDLRPQLTDRFDLSVEIRGVEDADLRQEIVRRRLAFEQDPAAFWDAWEEEERKLAARIVRARERVADVALPAEILRSACELAAGCGLDGHRAEIAAAKAARAVAALEGRLEVGPEDLAEAARLTFPHRFRRRPFEDGGEERERFAALMERVRTPRERPADEPAYAEKKTV